MSLLQVPNNCKLERRFVCIEHKGSFGDLFDPGFSKATRQLCCLCKYLDHFGMRMANGLHVAVATTLFLDDSPAIQRTLPGCRRRDCAEVARSHLRFCVERQDDVSKPLFRQSITCASAPAASSCMCCCC